MKFVLITELKCQEYVLHVPHTIEIETLDMFVIDAAVDLEFGQRLYHLIHQMSG